MMTRRKESAMDSVNGSTSARDSSHSQSPGFVMFRRSPESQELLRDPFAFALLGQIAFRARWRSTFSADGLEIGEALIGDYKKCGMTRREFRTRVLRLVKWGQITVRPTRKGTIARLTSTAAFDINSSPNECLTNEQNAKNRPSERPTVLPMATDTERPTERPTAGQLEANRRPLTNKERRKQGKNVAVVHAREGTTAAPATAATEKFSEEENQRQLEKIAQQAGNDPEQLCAALAPHFGQIDVTRELADYHKWMKTHAKSATARGFVRWLARCEPSLTPLPRKQSSGKNGEPPAHYLAARRASMEKADREHGLPSRFSLPVPPECDGTKAAERRPSRPAA
jgi:hypothetical protein